MYDRILVPTDGSEDATIAAEHAIELADRFDAALHVVYVVEPVDEPEVDIAELLAAFEEAGKRAVDEVIDMADGAGVGPIEGYVAQGVPHEAILDYADEHGIDMIVMGTHGRTGIDRLLLGSVTERVVRLSSIPVLTVGESEGSLIPPE